MSKPESIVVLGSGPAGLTASIYAARANLQPICIEGQQPGGQLTITSDVENFPGFENAILGPQLMDQFKKQALRFGTRFISQSLIRADFSKKPFELILEDQTQILTHCVIIATGASAKWLGLPSEKKFLGKGVSGCATCDGFFFKNQHVAVVGGGDTALEEATFLTRFAKQVTILHRRDKFRASQAMQQKAMKNPKIKILWNKQVQEVLGDSMLKAIKIQDTVTHAEEELAVDGLFIAIGHEPNTKPFINFLKCNSAGYIVVQPGSTTTSVPGVFAAGDVADAVYRQAITAAGSGCMAALDAERYLEEHIHGEQ